MVTGDLYYLWNRVYWTTRTKTSIMIQLLYSSQDILQCCQSSVKITETLNKSERSAVHDFGAKISKTSVNQYKNLKNLCDFQRI